jgi:type VI protein secretion system component VasK
MYYFTAFAYFLYLACKGICNLIISRNGDVDAAMVIAVFALLLSIWLVVSLAYTVTKYKAGEQPGIIFALVIFSLVFLWTLWYTWFVNGYKNRGRTYHQAKARASRDGAEASVSLLKGY